MTYLTELAVWVRNLEPAAAFLLLLPFVVAGAGLLQHWLEQRDAESHARGSGRPAIKGND